MVSIFPSVQVGPVTATFMWVFIALVAVGLLLSVGLGGAIVWALFWLVVLYIAYFIVRRIFGRAGGVR